MHADLGHSLMAVRTRPGKTLRDRQKFTLVGERQTKHDARIIVAVSMDTCLYGDNLGISTRRTEPRHGPDSVRACMCLEMCAPASVWQRMHLSACLCAEK